MIAFKEHPMFFLGLKYVQLLLSVLVVIFEITLYISYGKYYVSTYEHNDWFEKAQKEGDSNGEPKIWLLVVCSLTILCLVYNLISFKKICEKGSNIWIEIVFTALWLSVGLSNLNPVNKGTNLNCKSPILGDDDSPKQFICNLWVTSLIFGWFTFVTFMVTTFISWKLSKQVKEKIQWIKKSYPDSYNKSFDRKSFVSPRISPVPHPIITIRKNSTDELEKGGVPELLLQSGLPADHRMSLKVVLPQSGPFGQGKDGSDESDNSLKQQNQQEQDELSKNLSFPLPPTNVNASTLTLPNVEQHETFDPNHLIVPSKKSAEVSSLHEVPL